MSDDESMSDTDDYRIVSGSDFDRAVLFGGPPIFAAPLFNQISFKVFLGLVSFVDD